MVLILPRFLLIQPWHWLSCVAPHVPFVQAAEVAVQSHVGDAAVRRVCGDPDLPDEVGCSTASTGLAA